MLKQAAAAAFLVLSICRPVLAAEKQIWDCRTLAPDSQPILHLVEWGSRSYVKFAHLRFAVQHEVSGERMGWYWANEGDGYYRYGIVMESDGRAWFHDFAAAADDGLSEPLDQFSCRRTG